MAFQDKDYVALFLLSGATALFASMMVPIFPLWLLQKVGVSVSSIFYLLSILGLGGAILNSAVGYWSDRIAKRKIFVLATLILSALRFTAFAFFPFVWIVIVASTFTQFSAGGLIYANLRDHIRKKGNIDHEGQLNSVVRSAASFSFIIGPWVSTMTVTYVSYRAFFLFTACLSVVVFAFSYRFLSDVEESSQGVKVGGETKLLSNVPLLVMLGLTMVCLWTGNLTNGPLLSVFIEKYFASPFVLSAAFAIGPIAEIFVFPAVGIMNDRLTPRVTLIYGIIAEAMYFLFLTLSHNLWELMSTQIFGSFYVAVLFTSLIIYAQELFPTRIGLVSSLYYSCMQVATVIGNLVLGLVTTKLPLYTGFLALSLTSSLGLLIFFITAATRKISTGKPSPPV